MRFLITDLGGEDIILGYPWLATFEPHIVWSTATIDVTALPIVIQTINTKIPKEHPVITRTLAQPENDLTVQPTSETTIQTTATDLALAARHNTPKIEIPQEY